MFGKILQISYSFPIQKNTGIQRNVKVHSELKKYFSKVFLISSAPSSKPLNSNPDNSVHYIDSFDYRTIFNLFNKSDVKHTIKRRSGISLAIKVLDSFPTNLIIGEGGLIYITKAYFRAKHLIQEHNITYLYSSFRPYSDHFIAYLLKRKYPNLFWIADFRDPHIDPKRNNVLFPSFQHWCNAFILKKANTVTTVSKGLANYLKRYHEQIIDVKNGFDESSLGGINNPSYSKKFRITYTGSLYSEWQNADILWSTIKILLKENRIRSQDLEIIYAGKDGDLFSIWLDKYGLSPFLINHDKLEHKKIIHLQKSSNINLLLTWSSPQLTGILTSKLFEYLAAQQSILSLINGIMDEELNEIISEANDGLCLTIAASNSEQIKAFILQQYDTWKSSKPKITSKHDVLSKYSFQNQFKKLIPFLDSPKS